MLLILKMKVMNRDFAQYQEVVTEQTIFTEVVNTISDII
jgi:hypothetical protein